MSSETFQCHMCGQNLPLINKTIHELRCRGVRPAPQSKETDKMPSTSENSHNVREEEKKAPSRSNSIVHLDSDDYIESPPPSSARQQSDYWTCQRCTFKSNSIVSGMCEVCGAVDENMAAIAATIAEENMNFDDDDVQYNHNNGNSGGNASGAGKSNEWTCSQCTMINDIKHQQCEACGKVRPGQSSYRDRLIDDSDSYDDGHIYFPMDHGTGGNSSSSSSSSSAAARRNPLDSAYGGAVFGAGLGAALALMNDRSMTEGALAGAGVGALGGLLMDEMNRNSSSNSNNSGMRQTNMLFDDSDDYIDESPLFIRQGMNTRGNGDDIFERHNQMINRMMMMDPAMMAMLLRGGGIGGGSLLMGDAIDRMSYEELSERFQQPVRRVDEGTIEALPSRIIGAREATSGRRGNSNSSSSSSSSSGASAREAIDLTSSSPPNKLRRLPSNSSSGAAAAPPGEQREGCSICLGPYSPGEEVTTLPCLHQFHRECIQGWLRVNHTCPVCKHSLLQRK